MASRLWTRSRRCFEGLDLGLMRGEVENERLGFKDGMDAFLCYFATIACSFLLDIYTTVSSLPGEIALDECLWDACRGCAAEGGCVTCHNWA